MDPSLNDLQAQIDRLSLTIHQARDPRGTLEPVTTRLADLAERCNEILHRWSDVDQQHTRTLSETATRMEHLGALETRLEHDSLQRVRDLQSKIEHEWGQLRQAHEEPLKDLRAQTAALGEICVSAANVALQGFERAEARVIALETSLQDQIRQLSNDVQRALVENRPEPARPASIGVVPFPLEGVMRIHEEVRQAGGRGASVSPIAVARHDAMPLPLPLAMPPLDTVSTGRPNLDMPRDVTAIALAGRLDSLEREVTSEREQVRDSVSRSDRMRRDWRLALAAAGAVLAIAAIFGLQWQHRVNVRLDDAASRVAAAERQAQSASTAASQQVESSRAEADRQIAEARDAAHRSEIVTNVLASPDLLRFNLSGPEAGDRAYGQVLWSRSRGIILSAARLPALAPGTTYQLWLLSANGPVGAGTFVPDAAGRVTLAVENPANVPRPVTSVSVTAEPTGGSPGPTGTVVLFRAGT